MGQGDNIVINTGTINAGINQISGLVQAENYHEEKGNRTEKWAYDVALSYASEQEEYVRRVAGILKEENIKVFFAPDEMDKLTAMDMNRLFYSIYRYQCIYVASFVSTEYLAKNYTMHEATTALMREADEKRNCLIPIYFGDLKLPGLNPDIAYMRADRLREVETAERIRCIVNNYKNAR